MKQFSGFPAKMRFTPIPDFFFSALLSQISDIIELKVTLHILRALYHKRGYPRFVTHGELLGDNGLMSSLKAGTAPPAEALDSALGMATERGTLLRLNADKDEGPEAIYWLNTGQNREIIAKIESGELHLAGMKTARRTHIETEELPDIFTLYEQNIGMLTPITADELREAERLYPETWLRDAIKEAVNQNKRKWGYISAILERWSAEGRGDGTYRRDSAKKADPDKYIKGEYGHMVRR